MRTDTPPATKLLSLYNLLFPIGLLCLLVFVEQVVIKPDVDANVNLGSFRDVLIMYERKLSDIELSPLASQVISKTQKHFQPYNHLCLLDQKLVAILRCLLSDHA